MNTEKVIIYVDGASRGNPGPAAIAAIIHDEAGKPIVSLARRIGTTTNNEAEYRAIIAGLQKAVSLGVREVELKSDSELVVKQINGRYRVKAPALKPLYQQVKKLQGFLERLTITHISRIKNREADNLANKSLNLVSNIGNPENCRLIINLPQTTDAESDISYLNKLINTLKDFPGQDEVSLRIANEETRFIFKLTKLNINYCPELRRRLVKFIGKRGLTIETL